MLHASPCTLSSCPKHACVVGWMLVFALLAFVSAPKLYAGGPRFVSGLGMAVPAGQPEGWAVSQLHYFTDPGDLNATVNHAQADALVAAAASVWNVPSSSLSLSQGGLLAEHVSATDAYFNGSSFMFPADVEASNEAAIPVAVIYDADGSVTDLLLGSGASEPDGCRQNAVTESVDDVQTDGHIHHAILVVNGRCVGSTPEQLTQMQYQLTRAFGRVIGLAWSQTNDNVFTAVSTITADQENYWPLMHPLDALCGTYTYQCMLNPFTLRADDLSALAMLYPATGNAGGGTSLNVYGAISFPTGQGMDWVNVTAHRWHDGYTEPWELVSGVSGYSYQQALPNPVSQAQAENQGSYFPEQEGFFWMPAIPLDTVSTVYMTSEAINPLYTGAYALGPYVRPPATPSGSAQTSIAWFALGGSYGAFMTAADGASSCSPGNDGQEASPAAFDPSGWQEGQVCGWQHSSWWSATVRAGHSWTLEVTATDETGAAAANKLQPVMGIWNASDSTGTLPTLGSAAVPFNSMAMGVTQIRISAAGSDRSLRFAVSDEYGAGRPDFTYTARLLYADSVSPSSVGVGGGTVVLTGMGFRQGSVVRVNGVVAPVQSWTATQIVFTAPACAAVGAQTGVPVSISVTDPSTGGSTTISKALSYTQTANLLQQVSAPAALETTVAASTPFAVRVLASDGVTAVAGATVQFAVLAGSATLGLCGAAPSCTAVTDSNGVAQTVVTGNAAGTVMLSAAEVSGGATVQVRLTDKDPVRSVGLSATASYVAAGGGGSWSLQLTAVQDGSPASGVPVSWSVSPGLQLNAAASVVTNGTAAVMVNAANVVAGTANTLTACAWTTVCATWTVYGVDPSQWQVVVVSGAGQSVAETQSLSPVVLQVTDSLGHPVQAATVTLYQRVLAWEGACADPGRCASAPVLSTSETVSTSDAAGALAVTPLQLPGSPQVLEMAAATGTQGFVTLTLVKTPVAP